MRQRSNRHGEQVAYTSSVSYADTFPSRGRQAALGAGAGRCGHRPLRHTIGWAGLVSPHPPTSWTPSPEVEGFLSLQILLIRGRRGFLMILRQRRRRPASRLSSRSAPILPEKYKLYLFISLRRHRAQPGKCGLTRRENQCARAF